jgi:hypothetical protein
MSNSTAADREMVIIPKGTPVSVQLELKRLLETSVTLEQRTILKRLANNPKMRDVWSELARRDRKTHDFVYPARHPTDSRWRGHRNGQDAALAETVHFVYLTAVDEPTVSKPEENERRRKELQDKAAYLRQIADELARIGAQEADSLRSAAERYDQAGAAVRGFNDPLTIKNDRGDRRVRATQILISAFLSERFGDRLDGTAATLTAVALDVPLPSPRASRSAFSGHKGS